MQLWIVGLNPICPDCGRRSGKWGLVGIFDSREKALAACTTPDHFVEPIPLNEVDDSDRRWDSDYPLASDTYGVVTTPAIVPIS